MGIEQRMCSPAVLDKIVWADAEHKSTNSAKKSLQKLAEISVSAPTIREMSSTIGSELQEHLQKQAETHACGDLQPQYPESPQVAAVAIDGGRIMTRDKARRGVHGQAWKETKNACLHTMSSKSFEEDPHPALPACFANQAHVAKLVSEIHSVTVGSEETAEDAASPVSADECSLLQPSDPLQPDDSKRRCKKPDWRPKKLVRTCISSMVCSKNFGPLVAGEAQRRGFYQASRRAFLGDGQAWNWKIQQKYFQDFVAITDFVHPLGYIYNAAKAMAPQDYWMVYLKAATACWQGRISEFIEELQTWLSDHPATDDLSDQDPRAVVQRAITYLKNNKARMNYPEYRRQGLPTSTSAIESLIKEINYRVKGTEKFWNRPEGAEHILQIRAAALSDDYRLTNWILGRPGSYYYRPPKRATATAA